MDSQKSILIAVSDCRLQSVLMATFLFNPITRARVSQARSAAELAADCREFGADLVVVDARISDDNSDFSPLLNFYTQAHLMVFIDAGAPETIQKVMKSSARGILTSDATDREIQEAVAEITAGHIFFSRSERLGLMEALRKTLPAEPAMPELGFPVLTRRELAVVECLGLGLTNRKIEQELGVTEAAIKAHLSRIMVKWNVQDRLQILVAALKFSTLSVKSS